MTDSNVLGRQVPRYVQLAETLMRDIDKGRYAVGAMLPAEVELSQRYGVSRHTVREAMRRLAELGLVSRQQGIGTAVKARRAGASYVASISSLSDLFEYTRRTRLQVREVRWVTADGNLATMLRCNPGQRWLKFETRRYPADGDEPIALTEIYVAPEYERIREHFGDGSVWVYGLIEKHCGEKIVEMQQQIDAVAIPARLARILNVAPRSPGLHVLRYYLARGERLVSLSVNIYPRHRFTLNTRWRMQAEAGA
jgi:GntR family transcriptional regulator